MGARLSAEGIPTTVSPVATPEGDGHRGTSRARSPVIPSSWTGQRPFVGVDTLKLRGPVEIAVSLDKLDHLGLQLTPQGQVPSTACLSFPGGIVVRLDLKPEIPQASFEYSIPTLLRGHNLIPAPAKDALHAAAWIMEKSRPCLIWLAGPSDLKVNRLDIARDFRVQDRSALDAFVEGQRRLPLPYGPRVQTWTEDIGYTNLRRGTGTRWHCEIYDKHRQMQALAHQVAPGRAREARLAMAEEADGWFRCEVMLRRQVLQEQGVETFADVTDEKLAQLHRKYFQRSGFDREVGSMDKSRAVALLADDDDRKKLFKVLGMLFCDARGIPTEMCEKTRREYQKVAKRLDLSAADVDERREVSVRLDYDSGRLVGREDDLRSDDEAQNGMAVQHQAGGHDRREPSLGRPAPAP